MKFHYLYLLLALLFTGCAQLPDTELQQNNSWDEQQTKLEQLTHWSLTGKLAVITPDERNSVNIHWQQSDQDFHIHLSTFLGLSVLDIQKSDDVTTIIDADGNHYTSTDSEQLINELSGMVLPIEYLQQWIKGNPSGASYQLDDNQQVLTLLGGDRSNGIWSITYSDYQTVNNTNLPRKLQLIRDELRLKIAISKWQVDNNFKFNIEN